MTTRNRSGWVTLVAILFLLAGAFNLIVGLIGLGVDLGGGSAIENATRGDWPDDNLTWLSIALIVGGSLQLLAGAGIWARTVGGQVLGIALASLVVLTDIVFHRLLDGWALSGILINLAIIVVLCLKDDDFA